MTIYVLRNGVMVDKATGTPMLDAEQAKRVPAVPMVLNFKPYACPITGKEISTLGQHYSNLKKHDCVEANEVGSPTGGEIRNPRFAAKHGLQVSDRYKDEPHQWQERPSNVPD